MHIRSWLTAAVAAFAASAALAADLGVSVHVTDPAYPGVYGRVDIGRVPQPPAVIYPQPIIVQQPPNAVQRSPIYMRVPPGHAKKWDKHCHRYNACGQPVYFVQESWYRENVVQQRHGGDGSGKQSKHEKKQHEKHEKHEKKHHDRDKHHD